MSKPTPISGFPEWTTSQRMIEQFVLDRIRHTFELYGFAPLETRSVEPLDQLLRKGRPRRRSTCCAGCRPTRTARPVTTRSGCTST